jgi:hypothetical protein
MGSRSHRTTQLNTLPTPLEGRATLPAQPALDIRTLDAIKFPPQCSFARNILHRGIKAVTQATLAHEALKLLEHGEANLGSVLERFELHDEPLALSLRGLLRAGVPVPQRALTIARAYWPDVAPKSCRFTLAHPDFLNPLVTSAGGDLRPEVVRAFFDLTWSRTDLSDRAKMAGLLIVASSLWRASMALWARHAEPKAPSAETRRELVTVYDALLSGYTSGESRAESLAQGRIFLETITPGSRSASNEPLARAQRAHDNVRPPTPEQPTREPSVSTESGQPVEASNPRAPTPQETVELLRRLIRQLFAADTQTRHGAALEFRTFATAESPAVREVVEQGRQLADRIEKEEAKLVSARRLLEGGDLAQCHAYLAQHVVTSQVRFVREAGHHLMEALDDSASAERRHRQPDLRWRSRDGEALLRDYLIAGRQGGWAELVETHGRIFSGRIAFPSAEAPCVRLINPHRECTATFQLKNIKRINIFLDPPPEVAAGALAANLDPE